MNENRSLINIRTIAELKPIPERDRIELARVDGWWVIVGKDQCKIGDRVIYCEIDSRVNLDHPLFNSVATLHKLKDKFGYAGIKTIKMAGVYSQGLIIHPVPNFTSRKFPDDLTQFLNKYTKTATPAIVHAEEYNDLKSQWANPQKKYNRFQRWLRKIWFKLFPPKKKVIKSRIPTPYNLGVAKTDEERVQNLTTLFNDLKAKQSLLTATEKLDGQSATYHIDNDNNIYAASRNRALYFLSNKGKIEADSTWQNSTWQVAFNKYNIEHILKTIKIDWVKGLNTENPGQPLRSLTIQGELVGPGIQANPLELTELQFFVFNIIVDGKKCEFRRMAAICAQFNLTPVPLISDNWPIPSQCTLERFLEISDGQSTINPKVLREGLVYRTNDYAISFKAVSNKWLLKHEA